MRSLSSLASRICPKADNVVTLPGELCESVLVSGCSARMLVSLRREYNSCQQLRASELSVRRHSALQPGILFKKALRPPQKALQLPRVRQK